ncbi:hypothetical protein FRC03_006374, partial [Tulasnella sp. 419]
MKGFEAAILLGLLRLLPDVHAATPLWQQCGGNGWSGDPTCVSGAVCVYVNDWYSQCQPAPSTTSTRPATTSSVTSRTTSVTTSSARSSSSSTRTSVVSSSTSSGPTPTDSKWAAAYTKAKAAVAKLSNTEKANLGTGTYWQKGPCVGNTPAISSINFPGLCLQDAPLGVRFADKVSVFPAGINAAATWDRDLIRQRGVALAEEFRGKGVHVALGPAMNMARIAHAGRNWEGFGGDPFLSGEASYETIIGMQSVGVQACAKHYINNEQERNRETSSSNVDDRSEHEIYGHTFLRSVQAGVTSFMCSYNQINGTFACENDRVLNQILKNEFGFQGFVMTDWWAKISGPTAANKGLDMLMPGDTAYNTYTSYFGPALVSAVQNGQVPQSRLDDIATRILAGWYYLGQDSGYPA